MAIDTRAKRQSVAGFSLFRVRLVPDGTINALDRRHVAGLYAGIAAAAPEAPTPSAALGFSAVTPSLGFSTVTPTLRFTGEA